LTALFLRSGSFGWKNSSNLCTQRIGINNQFAALSHPLIPTPKLAESGVLDTLSFGIRRMALNLAARMKLTGINQLWVADITYIRLSIWR
jgi:hypothetical protein